SGDKEIGRAAQAGGMAQPASRIGRVPIQGGQQLGERQGPGARRQEFFLPELARKGGGVERGALLPIVNLTQGNDMKQRQKPAEQRGGAREKEGADQSPQQGGLQTAKCPFVELTARANTDIGRPTRVPRSWRAYCFRP